MFRQRNPVATKWWLWLGVALFFVAGTASAEVPTPKPWPTRFYALLYQNFRESLAILDLWYDWEKGGNLHIVTEQLGPVSYRLQWNNGTVFTYDVEGKTCESLDAGVGIVRPNWLEGASYLGTEVMDGFTCNVWTKEDFIIYREDIVTKLPVSWDFLTTGRHIHVITFEEGIKLQEERWQAPASCFGNKENVALNNSFVRETMSQTELKGKGALSA